MRVEVVPTDPWHVRMLVENLRPYEHEVFAKLNRGDPEDIINGIIANGDVCVSGFYGDDIGAIIGIHPLRAYSLETEAHIWLIGTPLIDRHPLVFGRASKRFIESLCYTRLVTYRTPEFDKGTGWHEWLGFVEVGVDMGFVRMERRWIPQPH